MKFQVTDLKGKKFGKLTVIELSHKIKVKRGSIIMWLCKCDCGKEKIIRSSDLQSGSSKSCGCGTIEAVIKRCSSHGLIKTSEYYSWASMIQRCTNTNAVGFEHWGGRGIEVCARWLKFENFLEDMGKKPSKKHSIDRFPNINGNYEVTNCRWATRAEQSRGKTNNRYLEYRGINLILIDWARKFKVTHTALSKYILKHGLIEAMEYYYHKK